MQDVVKMALAVVFALSLVAGAGYVLLTNDFFTGEGNEAETEEEEESEEIITFECECLLCDECGGCIETECCECDECNICACVEEEEEEEEVPEPTITEMDAELLIGSLGYYEGEWIEHPYGVVVLWMYATFELDYIDNITKITFIAYDDEDNVIGTAVSEDEYLDELKAYMAIGVIECPFSSIATSAIDGWVMSGIVDYPTLPDRFGIEILLDIDGDINIVKM